MVVSWTLGRPKKSASKNVKTGAPADIIINRCCGGLANVAKEATIAPSTIQSWLKSGNIPIKRRALIAAIASERGHKISEAHFEGASTEGLPDGE